jgi:hypothetical protein
MDKEITMDRYRRRPPMEGFSPNRGGLGRGGEFTDDDTVEGHLMDEERKDLGEDTEGHWASSRKRVEDEEDTEGHARKRATDDDDTEGHGLGLKRATDDDDDTEGHWASKRATDDDDDTEGHGANFKR